MKGPSFVFDDNMVNQLQTYYEENFAQPNYRIVRDIIEYVAAQGMDKKESVELLASLLDSTGISEEEIDFVLSHKTTIVPAHLFAN